MNRQLLKSATPAKKLARPTTEFKDFSPYENGRVRRFKFDVNALADFEQETGMGFAQLMRQRAVFGSARAMIWAGLKHEDRALRIEDVGDLLTDYITDEQVKKGEHTIDTILMVAIAAAIEQGALGRRVDDEEDAEHNTASGEVVESLPNALASGETTSIPTTQE